MGTTGPRIALDSLERVEIRSAEELRRWLERNHHRDQGVWLVHFKKGAGRPWVPMSSIVDEALCFGWIDSLPRKLDADRTMTLLTPRRPGSAWSAVNKRKLARLEADGRLEAPGLARVRAAKLDGSWERLDGVETLEPPDDLAAALDREPMARRFFDRFPPSSRRGILEWIAGAKRPETRARRIAETVRKAAVNRKANHPVGRDAGPKPG